MSDEDTDIDESPQASSPPQEEVSAISTECEVKSQLLNESSPHSSTSESTATSSFNETKILVPPDKYDSACITNENDNSSEIYFLIWKFLTASPCSNAAKFLASEINQMKLLPKRLDWQGNYHDHTLESYSRIFSHLKDDHLMKLVTNEVSQFASWPVVPRNRSLLLSISPVNHRKRKIPSSLPFMAHVSGNQVVQSSSSHHNSNYALALSSQPYQGPIGFSNYISTHFYSKYVMHRRLLGHLSAVYCVCFDRTGKYIISGADDLLVKIWSSCDGRLIATLRGHSAEIADISVSQENTLIATGSVDKHIRIWCLQTTAPICVLTSHQQQVTTVNFCPLLIGETRYLVSTSQDGSLCFWKVNVNTNFVEPKPIKFDERGSPGAHIVCASFSSGGSFLALGATDRLIRVFHVNAPHGPVKILELEAHADHVDSIVFSNRSLKFVSGSKDGHAHIWYYERQCWKNLTLDMSEKSPMFDPPERVKVNMVGWSSDDRFIITSCSDGLIRVWNSITGKLIHCLKGHDDDAFVIEAHPTDGRIVLTAGHDGKTIIWDIVEGKLIKVFCNSIEGQGRGLILDLKISPDGRTFAATDSHAHVMIFGFGSSKPYEKVPSQVFFHTDYRPLVRDMHNYVIDEQTQCPPHLMPPPFLVDIDGNPHPPIYQRLVPGRENCNEEQLVPHIAVHNERGVNEILQPANENLDINPPNANNNANIPHVQVNIPGPSGLSGSARQSALDAMIESLANQLELPDAPENAPSNSRPPQPQPHASASNGSLVSPQASSSSSLNAPPAVNNRRVNHARNSSRRRLNSVQANEGVRTTGANWQTVGGFIGNSSVWSRDRPAVRSLNTSELDFLMKQTSQFSQAEEEHHSREKKKRPLVLPAISPRSLINPKEKFTRRKKRLNEQRQGLRIAHQNMNRARSSNNATIQRHMRGFIDEDNEELLNALSDQSSHGVQSGAESWSERDTSQSESSDDSSDASSDESSSNSGDGSGSDSDYDVKRRSQRLKRPTRDTSHKSWQKLCKQLIEDLVRMEESEPFRDPVDQMMYPDYSRVVETPMDLSGLLEQLNAKQYENITEFKHDLYLIFKNSRAYNTDKTTPIYKWTTKVWKAADAHLAEIQRELRRSRVKSQSSHSADRSSDRRSSSRSETRTRRANKRKGQSKKGKAVKRQLPQQGTASRDKGKRIVKRVPTQPKALSPPLDEMDVKPGPSRIGEGSSSSGGQSRTHFLKSLVASDDDDDDDTIENVMNAANSETEIEDNADFHVNFDSDATVIAEPAVSPFTNGTDVSLDGPPHLLSDQGSETETRDSPVAFKKRKSVRRVAAKRKRITKKATRKRRRVKVETDDDATDIDESYLLDENNVDPVIQVKKEEEQVSEAERNGTSSNIRDTASIDSGSNGSLADHDYATLQGHSPSAGPRTRCGGVPRVKYIETGDDEEDEDGFTQEELANSSDYAFPSTGLTNNGKTTSRSGRTIKLKPFIRTVC